MPGLDPTNVAVALTASSRMSSTRIGVKPFPARGAVAAHTNTFFLILVFTKVGRFEHHRGSKRARAIVTRIPRDTDTLHIAAFVGVGGSSTYWLGSAAATHRSGLSLLFLQYS